MLNLQKLYQKYNAEYWHGLLPNHVVVEFSLLLPKDFMEGTYLPETGLPWPPGCGPKPKTHTIRLHKILSDQRLEPAAHMTLFHAMVHVEGLLGNRSLFYHGAAFHGRMNQLANAGAFDRHW